MGQILHGSGKTTHAVRAAIQRSKTSIKELAGRYDLNPKTVMKWRKRAFLMMLRWGRRRHAQQCSAPRRKLSLLLFASHAVAARRLSLCAPGDHPASDTIIAASTVPTPRDQQAPCDRRRDGAQEGVQALSDRLLPHRYRRGPY